MPDFAPLRGFDHTAIRYRRSYDARWYYLTRKDVECSEIEEQEGRTRGGGNTVRTRGLSHYEYYGLMFRDYLMECVDTDTEHVYWRLPPSGLDDNNNNIAYEARGVDCTPINPTSQPSRHTPLIPSGVTRMIKVGITRIDGKLKLLVNATDFHTQLDEMGCAHSGSTGGAYIDGPLTNNAVADSGFRMSPAVLLKRDYREVEVPVTKDGVRSIEKRPVTACIDLAGIWGTPPSFEQLKKLCSSAEVAARKILEHYQPIDIAVEIHKKVVK